MIILDLRFLTITDNIYIMILLINDLLIIELWLRIFIILYIRLYYKYNV
jgi:hypothetical protein